MPIQLYLWGPSREQILQKHDFYVAQVQKRFFAQFAEIEREADEFAEAEYQRLGNQPGYGDWDPADAAENARDSSQEFYGLLHDMRDMMRQSALAGCYHQWDKELRDFLEREIGRGPGDHNKKLIWNSDLRGVIDILAEFGWNVTAEPFYPALRASQLIITVYKHGKGSALDQLAKNYPRYVRNPLGELSASWAGSLLTHEWLEVSDEDFVELTSALRAFWVRFPERLVYDG